jgi:glutamate/tyrosine decarboxylase-like PLP-dependent enzyme
MRGARRPAAAGDARAEDLGVLDDLARRVQEYVRECRRGEVPVVEYKTADELQDMLDVRVCGEGCADRELLSLIETYLACAVRTAHPHFSNQLFGGFSLAGLLGDVTASLTNTTMATFEAAPAATILERAMIGHLLAKVGFDGGEGILCPGGSHANLLGVLCARQRALPDAGRQGLRTAAPLQVFVSDQAHYSLARAAGLLGLGSSSVIAVATDGAGRMDARALEQRIARSASEGQRPLMVVATSGTTVLGAFDPLREIAAVAHRHGLWLHVDGAWGGPVLLSERHRALLDGSELADSFTWDAHKLMGTPLSCSAFLARRAGTLHAASALGEEYAGYLFHDGEEAELDLGRSSLLCGRRADVLKLWLLWKRHGDRGLAARIDHLFDLAEHARASVIRHARLELVAPVQSLQICLRWLPRRGGDPDRFNLDLRERLRRTGRALVNHARVRGRLALRLVLANADLQLEDLDRFFERVTATAEELEALGPPATCALARTDVRSPRASST